MQKVMLNGQILAKNDAVIPISDRGFRFGDGVFETMRVHKGMVWQFDWHMGRLHDGLTALHIPYDVASLQADCAKTLKENNQSDGLLRIQITRGSSGQGYLPTAGHPTCVIETLPLTPSPKDPVALWLSSYVKTSERALPVQNKLCQGLNSTLARMQAAENNCFEALQLNDAGEICEASSANIFWMQDDILHTPALECGVLSGATRAAICKATPAKMVRSSLQALEKAEAVCITNVSWGVVPVKALLPNNIEYDSESLAGQLNDFLREDLSSNSKNLE